MKICVSSSGPVETAAVDLRFGRCANFVVYSTTENRYTALANQGVHSSHGAGIAAAQQVIDEKVDVLVTGNMGPNAMELVKAAGIEIYGIAGGTAEEAVNLYLKGSLTRINQAVLAHSGMEQRGRRDY